MNRNDKAVIRPPATPVRRVDFLLHKEIEMGEKRRDTEGDIGDNQAERRPIDYIYEKKSIFRISSIIIHTEAIPGY